MILEQDLRAQNTIRNEKYGLIMHRQVPRHAVNADGGWQVFRRTHGGRDCGRLRYDVQCRPGDRQGPPQRVDDASP